MTKGTIHLSVDTDIIELCKLYRKENSDWSISRAFEDYCRTFFDVTNSIDGNENKKEVEENILKLKKELSKEQAKSNIMKQNEKRTEKEKMERIMEQVREIQERNRGL